MRTTSKPFNIGKKLVYEAYKAVKANGGAAGVDGQTIEQFEDDLKGNLYRIWNRMSSGSYFPPPVRAVSIPKKSGGQRTLGVPTVADRVAQMVVKQVIEPDLDAVFLADSYGYRPGKSALDAVGITRERCWKYDWILEFDIKGLFDNIDHELLLRAVRRHVTCPWALLYIERWLTAPMRDEKGVQIERTRGTPQGGVVSPILANTFLHYAFDLWMTRTHPDLPWCRYADDGLVHCRSEHEAQVLKDELQARLAACGLEMHPTKTKIVYCKDGKRQLTYPTVKFDFLGYCFRPRLVRRHRDNTMFCGFNPAVSVSALKAMRSAIRDLNLRRQTQLSLQDLARQLNPLLRGWIDYYGRFAPSALAPLLRYVNQTLLAWAMRKFKRFKAHKIRASQFLQQLAAGRPDLFVHWRRGMVGTFA
ncbi:group II intron reverse transcriptase/maturase [Paraburkholderia sp. LEh10]|uniref:group II intron reverse transcriptase/maturase n=1 Tax=Paraburkholderia sp. LEh10 TaxID=2821353 RepID=UPI001AE72BA2|nr:group II intron reverse transcriptase/maturase [Paraburkholderia sp. LEh10]MBP0593662.1 group II intron reverse transcriptase/maturase [Paraburkholderia sp. LEh10]